MCPESERNVLFNYALCSVIAASAVTVTMMYCVLLNSLLITAV